MRGIHRCIAAICLFATAAPHGAGAQQDQIPKELALALIPAAGSQGGEIVVGKLPPDLAASIPLPPGGRILGSFMTLGRAEAVMTLPFALDSAGSFVRHALVDHGWVLQESMARRPGGLQFTPPGTVPTLLCKRGTQEGVSLTSQPHGQETLVRLTLMSEVGYCYMTSGTVSAERVEFVQMQPRGFVPLASVPPLWSPGDPVASMRACRGSNPNNVGLASQTQEQELRTGMSEEEILSFYGKQLDSAGWKVATPIPRVSRTWSKATPNGDSTQDVTLTVSKLSTPSCYQLELRAMERGPRR